MLRKTMYVSLFVCLVCLLSGSMVSALNLNRNSDPEFPFSRTSSLSSTLSPLAAVPCVDGMAGDYPCNNIDLMAFMSFSELGSAEQSGSDIWGWTDSQTGDEYAIMTLSDGTAFVRISDPENPVLLGFLPTHTVSSSWHDAKVYADHAFIVSEAGNHGMQVFDLTQLSGITATTSVSPTTIFTNTAHYGEFGNAHNIVINEETGYAYAVGTSTCAGGLHFVNIADPLNPQNEGCFDADGYTHDAQCVIYNGLDTEHVGKEICFNSNEDTLTVVDVSDKSAPIQLSRTGYDNAQYTHQGWLTVDHAYLLLNDELDEQRTGVTTETYVWNMADLDVPVIETIYTGGLPAADHNLYTRGDSAFLSNYTSGLRVLSIPDPTNPVEIGYFDVYPEDNSPNFSGTWSNYPYFESGNIIISSIDRGMFIVRPQAFAIMAESNVIVSCDGSPVATNLSIRSFFDADTANAVALASTSPSGATSVFSTSSVSIGQSSVVTITPSADGENGMVLVEAMLGGNSASTEIAVVQSAPPVIPLSMPNLAAVSSFSDTFSWEAGATATSYLFEVSDTPAFTNIIYTAEVAETTHTAQNLPASQVLYWRVSAVNACGSTPSATQTVISLATNEQCSITYSDSFESEPSALEGWFGFTFEPDDLTVTPWELGATGAYSSTAGWSLSDTGYAGSIMFPPFLDVPGTPATFRFWQKRNLGADDVVMVVYGDGTTINPIGDEQISEPFDTVSDVWAGEEIVPFPVFGWSGVQDWTETAVDVSPYVRPDGTLDIFFMSFMGNEASNEAGVWAIDNVSLETCVQEIIPADLSALAGDYGVAWHSGDGVQHIGASWSDELVITGTDTSDDLVLPTLQTDQDNTITVDVAQDGWLMGWFDWNSDGQFTDDELTIDQAVVTATNSIDISIPTEATIGDIAYRVRVTLDSTSPALSATGYAADGEVEDGMVIVSSATATMVILRPVNIASANIFLITVLITILSFTSLLTIKRRTI